VNGDDFGGESMNGESMNGESMAVAANARRIRDREGII
jgi:hypothetical protein